jgi:hypothetical protein
MQSPTTSNHGYYLHPGTILSHLHHCNRLAIGSKLLLWFSWTPSHSHAWERETHDKIMSLFCIKPCGGFAQKFQIIHQESQGLAWSTLSNITSAHLSLHNLLFHDFQNPGNYSPVSLISFLQIFPGLFPFFTHIPFCMP